MLMAPNTSPGVVRNLYGVFRILYCLRKITDLFYQDGPRRLPLSSGRGTLLRRVIFQLLQLLGVYTTCTSSDSLIPSVTFALRGSSKTTTSFTLMSHIMCLKMTSAYAIFSLSPFSKDLIRRNLILLDFYGGNKHILFARSSRKRELTARKGPRLLQKVHSQSA